MPRDADTIQSAVAHPTRFCTPAVIADLLRGLAKAVEMWTDEDGVVESVEITVDTSGLVSTIGRVTVTWEES